MLELPKEVEARVDGSKVFIKGLRGEIRKEFKSYRIKVLVEGNIITIKGEPNNKQTLVLVETIASHIANMVEGVVLGYRYRMKVIYSHFPMSISVDKQIVSVKNFLGEKFPRKVRIIGDTKVEVNGQEVIVSGIDKEAVGQTASNLELKTKVKGKDMRRFQDGLFIVDKGNISESKERESLVKELKG